MRTQKQRAQAAEPQVQPIGHRDADDPARHSIVDDQEAFLLTAVARTTGRPSLPAATATTGRLKPRTPIRYQAESGKPDAAVIGFSVAEL